MKSPAYVELSLTSSFLDIFSSAVLPNGREKKVEEMSENRFSTYVLSE
jgi:hypothetical protein